MEQTKSVEAERIAKLIKQNNVDTFLSKVDVNTFEALEACATDLAELSPDTIVMLLATTPLEKTGDSSLFLHVIIPARAYEHLETKWLEYCVSTVNSGACNSVFESVPATDVKQQKACITFAAKGEQSPIKLVEVAMGNAFAYLKKCGLYHEPDDDEKEYDFNDIE